MWAEPHVRSQLAGADLELQFRCVAIAIARDATLAYVGRTLGERADERKHSCPYAPHAAGRATPLEIEDVGVRFVGAGANQRKSRIRLTPRFDVR